MKHVGERWDHKVLCGRPENYVRGKISTQRERSRKAERFHRKITLSLLCVCVSWPYPILSHSTHTYISGDKRKGKEKKQIIFSSSHHHHVVLSARLSLTLLRHFSQSFIALGRSSGLHPVSSHSCCMYVRAGRPAFVRPYEGIHRSTSLMSSSLLLQQCPACLVRLTWIVFVIGGWWPYSWCFVGCCSILLGSFLCNCCLAFSPAVLLASK